MKIEIDLPDHLVEWLQSDQARDAIETNIFTLDLNDGEMSMLEASDNIAERAM